MTPFGFGSSNTNKWSTTTKGNAVDPAAVPKVSSQPPGVGEPAAGKPAAKTTARERTDLEKAIADAIAIKTSYSTAELDSKRLLESMTSDRSYKKEQLAYFEELTELTARMAAAKESKQFFKDFVLKDLVDSAV